MRQATAARPLRPVKVRPWPAPDPTIPCTRCGRPATVALFVGVQSALDLCESCRRAVAAALAAGDERR